MALFADRLCEYAWVPNMLWIGGSWRPLLTPFSPFRLFIDRYGLLASLTSIMIAHDKRWLILITCTCICKPSCQKLPNSFLTWYHQPAYDLDVLWIQPESLWRLSLLLSPQLLVWRHAVGTLFGLLRLHLVDWDHLGLFLVAETNGNKIEVGNIIFYLWNLQGTGEWWQIQKSYFTTINYLQS